MVKVWSALAATACAAPLAIAAMLGGCGKKNAADDPQGAPAASSSAAASSHVIAKNAVVLDPIAHMEDCTFGHRGVLLDLGDTSMRGRFVTKLDAPEPPTIEHEGATWVRVKNRALAMRFYWSSELDPKAPAPPVDPDGGVSVPSAYVEARVHGISARSVSVYLNGKVVGGFGLANKETKVGLARGGSSPLLPGENELLLRFNGGSKKDDDTLAEVDWIHVGEGDGGEPYAAPTRQDVVVQATAGGVSKRALSLRAPGFVRCAGWIPPGASARALLAVEGAGEADVEVRLLRDRSTPLLLRRVHVTGATPTLTGGAPSGDKSPAWSELSVPLGDVGPSGTLAAVEIAAVRASKGARVLFGEPQVITSNVPEPTRAGAAARGVVMVVLGDVSSRPLAPFGEALQMNEMTLLANQGVTFRAHRASTSMANGALASMLSGLAARAHTLEDPDARLPRAITTIADAARQAGVATAMFTANPTTGAVFGFDRGWDTFVAHAPGEDAPSTQVFDDAIKWIDEHKDRRFLVVVHARGGHPPWQATPDELKTMPPASYQGQLDPKRAAELLVKSQKMPGHLSDADRARAWALYAHALTAHDAALAKLTQSLTAAGRDADTAVIVTGDSAPPDATPLSDSDALDEPLLAVPLIVRAPGSELAGRAVTVPTTGVDLARTALGALGLEPPAAFGGTDLLALARGEASAGMRPLVATTAARFALRWGPFVLLGTREHVAKLCDLSLEPSCTSDVRKTYPLAEEELQRAALAAFGDDAHKRPPEREPAFIDPATMQSLVLWGRPPEKHKKGDD